MKGMIKQLTMENREEFLKDIFEIAEKINKTDKSFEIMMLIDDANSKYDKHFNKLLSNKGIVKPAKDRYEEEVKQYQKELDLKRFIDKMKPTEPFLAEPVIQR